ncbi:hypothetical protein BT96DRAFT_376361 [Gymnopus androsaceus JB14]|uniref:Uncharacterized protein n=1 Tax=Gymnopus androsaceus JB14 TaxID=1447944 RepID=A0A6A4IIX6_9AGAR|nr:hypothetical protein BT96DRAFT_376361 [Gymnopus androsaceus JB14]
MIPPTMTWPVKVLSIALALSASTRGQTTNATCATSFTWAENTAQQSPCLVTALLESLCEPGVQLPALPPSNHYTGPSFGLESSTCECSTVTYMLISACGACQNREWISWQEWSENCPTIELSVFPVQIPTSINVPLWAYMNISSINVSSPRLPYNLHPALSLRPRHHPWPIQALHHHLAKT